MKPFRINKSEALYSLLTSETADRVLLKCDHPITRYRRILERYNLLMDMVIPSFVIFFRICSSVYQKK